MNKVKLSKILKNGVFKDGDWIESKDQDPDGEIRLIQLADIGDGYFINKSNRFINKKTAIKLRCTFLEKGDILVARMPDPLGRCCIFPLKGSEEYVTAVDVCIIRPSSDISTQYLAYMINSPFNRSEINRQSTGTTRRRITRKRLGSLEIPLPPLKTQQHIAQILDDAAELRDKTKQLLTEYDLLAQSIFLDMFGDPEINPKKWEKVQFKKLFIQSKVSVKPENIINGQKYLGLEHIEKETGEIISHVKVKENELKSNKFWFTENHVLYGKLRPYLNKVATPKFEGICSTDIIPFKAIQGKSNKAFLTYLLKGQWFVNYANERTSGANLPRISPNEINKFESINPPIELQNQFAEKIALIEQQKELAKQELKESEDLFNCLLQKAFKGELV